MQKPRLSILVVAMCLLSIVGIGACTPKDDESKPQPGDDGLNPPIVLPTNITGSQFLIACNPVEQIRQHSANSTDTLSVECNVTGNRAAAPIERVEWGAFYGATELNPTMSVTNARVRMSFPSNQIFPLNIKADVYQVGVAQPNQAQKSYADMYALHTDGLESQFSQKCNAAYSDVMSSYLERQEYQCFEGYMKIYKKCLTDGNNMRILFDPKCQS